ncbi:hypothetical protein [Prevotella sp. HCN-7019]|uniref:hypothetical protein n=1 Tax=Prevotella sp. HCN-7019 TaxID=3134668 RepID=UPI002639FA2D
MWHEENYDNNRTVTSASRAELKYKNIPLTEKNIYQVEVNEDDYTLADNDCIVSRINSMSRKHPCRMYQPHKCNGKGLIPKSKTMRLSQHKNIICGRT